MDKLLIFSADNHAGAPTAETVDHDLLRETIDADLSAAQSVVAA